MKQTHLSPPRESPNSSRLPEEMQEHYHAHKWRGRHAGKRASFGLIPAPPRGQLLVQSRSSSSYSSPQLLISNHRDFHPSCLVKGRACRKKTAPGPCRVLARHNCAKQGLLHFTRCLSWPCVEIHVTGPKVLKCWARSSKRSLHSFWWPWSRVFQLKQRTTCFSCTALTDHSITGQS